ARVVHVQATRCRGRQLEALSCIPASRARAGAEARLGKVKDSIVDAVGRRDHVSAIRRIFDEVFAGSAGDVAAPVRPLGEAGDRGVVDITAAGLPTVADAEVRRGGTRAGAQVEL